MKNLSIISKDVNAIKVIQLWWKFFNTQLNFASTTTAKTKKVSQCTFWSEELGYREHNFLFSSQGRKKKKVFIVISEKNEINLLHWTIYIFCCLYSGRIRQKDVSQCLPGLMIQFVTMASFYSCTYNTHHLLSLLFGINHSSQCSASKMRSVAWKVKLAADSKYSGKKRAKNHFCTSSINILEGQYQ